MDIQTHTHRYRRTKTAIFKIISYTLIGKNTLSNILNKSYCKLYHVFFYIHKNCMKSFKTLHMCFIYFLSFFITFFVLLRLQFSFDFKFLCVFSAILTSINFWSFVISKNNNKKLQNPKKKKNSLTHPSLFKKKK